MDDIFGGANSKSETLELKNQIISTGLVTTAIANLEKCHGPAQRLTILGTLYDAIKRTVTLPPKKQEKYCLKLTTILESGEVTSKELEQLVGYLVWASYTEPFGRPFISAISNAISRSTPKETVFISGYVKLAIRIWLSIIEQNKGISYDYVLNRMPHAQYN